MSERLKMLEGMPYQPADAELAGERRRAAELLARYNAARPGDDDIRRMLLGALLGAGAEEAEIRPVFACDYGFNIRLGRRAFINSHCVFLDCAPIEIGDHLQMGPGVQLLTALHPLSAALRRTGIEEARPILIGHDVWIGGGAVVLPGVMIGDRSVVGAGSVVTKDVEPDCVVVGNPARLLRRLEPDRPESAPAAPDRLETPSAEIANPRRWWPFRG